MADRLAATGNSSQSSEGWAWTMRAVASGEIGHPDQLRLLRTADHNAMVPGTVASALDALGQWTYETPLAIDACDWWYSTSFPFGAESGDSAPPAELLFDGLATLCDVWLNGTRILTTTNMFRRYRLAVGEWLRPENVLALNFKSLQVALGQKRPRPKWKTNLVSHQQVRWHRTTLLGYIPGWSPPVPAIGPWKPITLLTSPIRSDELRLQTELRGCDGVVTVHLELAAHAAVDAVIVRVGGQESRLNLLDLELPENQAGETLAPTDVLTGGRRAVLATGDLTIPNVDCWWPHTHGTPHLYECEIVAVSEGRQFVVDHRQIGFRNLTTGEISKFAIKVNGIPVYCRGACWTVSDILKLTGSVEQLKHELTLLRDAGANLVRVGGTMVYESDLFYSICDELGLMVWQDFMFANMDYPVGDAAFLENISVEATQQVVRLAMHPAVVVYCGNSEVEQQAAMLGVPSEWWSNDWFANRLPAICRQFHSGAAYVPATPTGGALPFQLETGLSHFYGIGAYRRTMAEVRSARVQFTPECLGFSNIPEETTVAEICGSSVPVCHDPKWKRRVPRDTGAGWDFEDIRDHYLEELYGVGAMPLRARDGLRSLQLSRTVPGEMMAQVFAEWRSTHSTNQGAMVWFYKDLWPAAGWGILDSRGFPKAAYYALKRTWQPQQILITDEGLNGLDLHVVNEDADAATFHVEVRLLREPETLVARRGQSVRISGRSCERLSVDAILGGFYDVNYAYRFGPQQHDVVVASLRREGTEGEPVSEAFFFVNRKNLRTWPQSVCGVSASAVSLKDGSWEVTVEAQSLLQSIRLSAPGYLPSDNYFHLIPNQSRRVLFRQLGGVVEGFRGQCEALNLETPVAIVVVDGTSGGSA